MKLTATIYFFIIFGILGPSISQACSCNFEYLKKITNNPKNASSSFIALFKDGYFEVKRNWKPVPSIKFKTSASFSGHVTKCDMNLTTNQEYLILSTENTEDPMRLSICSVNAIKLKDAKDLIAKLDNPSVPEPVLKPQPEKSAEKISGTKFEIPKNWNGTIKAFCEHNLPNSTAVGGVACSGAEVHFAKSYGDYRVTYCGESTTNQAVKWSFIFCGNR